MRAPSVTCGAATQTDLAAGTHPQSPWPLGRHRFASVSVVHVAGSAPGPGLAVAVRGKAGEEVQLLYAVVGQGAAHPILAKNVTVGADGTGTAVLA